MARKKKEVLPEDLPPFLQYRRRGITELRSYVPGEDLSKITVEPGVKPKSGDYVQRDPVTGNMWLIDKEYAESNFELRTMFFEA